MKSNLTQSLGFELETQPVAFFHNGELKLSAKHQLITRSDNGHPLSVMGGTYVPMLVKDFEESTKRLSDISGYPIVGYEEFNEGRVILSFLKNTNKTEAVGIPIEDYIVIGSSADGTRPFFVGTSTILIRCTNAFSKINQIDRIRHTKSAPIRMEEMYNYFEKYLEEKNTLYHTFEDMISVKVNDSERDEFAKFILSIPNDESEIKTRRLNRLGELIDCIRVETNDVGKNVFGLLQGVTKFTTHNMETKKDTFGSVFGKKAWYNEKAFERCLEYVK